MIQLIYASYATTTMTHAELQTLQTQSQTNNHRKGITGLLLYKAEAFIQVLEGQETDVLALYTTICNDPRHTNIRKLVQRRILEREFSRWAMGFRNLDKIQFHTLRGLEASGNFQDSLTKPKFAKTLLTTFLSVTP
jgi:hypothetical protein